MIEVSMGSKEGLLFHEILLPKDLKIDLNHLSPWICNRSEGIASYLSGSFPSLHWFQSLPSCPTHKKFRRFKSILTVPYHLFGYVLHIGTGLLWEPRTRHRSYKTQLDYTLPPVPCPPGALPSLTAQSFQGLLQSTSTWTHWPGKMSMAKARNTLSSANPKSIRHVAAELSFCLA